MSKGEVNVVERKPAVYIAGRPRSDNVQTPEQSIPLATGKVPTVLLVQQARVIVSAER